MIVNILLTGVSIHVAGKPAEVTAFLARLARAYRTLGDLLAPEPNSASSKRGLCGSGQAAPAPDHP